MPAAEFDVTEDLVRRLLVEQIPELSDLPIELLAYGWDNVSFQLGSELVARLPRRELSAGLIANEVRWLPVLAPHLPLPVPAPVFHGIPGAGYPWEWLIAPLLPGKPASSVTGIDFDTCAGQLGRFLASLHQPAPDGAPENPFRGGPLSDRDGSTRERLEILIDEVDTGALLKVWERALAAPVHNGPAQWLHGDAHPGNLLVLDGRLSGVIDFGDITAGDPATDLAIVWTFLPAGHRDVFWSTYGVADEELDLRARGWALSLGTAYLAYSADNPDMRGIGERALTAVLEEG
jgi:aminoglycoside phosphotransferase (APT) family kinase protein